MENFEECKFAIQLIAKGSYVDREDDQTYIIETYTIRLSAVAYQEWMFTETMNTREVYGSEKEWQEHIEKYLMRSKIWRAKICDALGGLPNGGVSITQSQSEVFTVVHIYEV